MKTRTKSFYADTSNVDLYNARRLPARLTIEQTAMLLYFQPYELLLLMRVGLLKCLNPSTAGANCRKLFSTDYVQKLAADPGWLTQATKIVAKTVQANNGRTTHSFKKTNRVYEN
jgi:hypothetical protein